MFGKKRNNRIPPTPTPQLSKETRLLKLFVLDVNFIKIPAVAHRKLYARIRRNAGDNPKCFLLLLVGSYDIIMPEENIKMNPAY